MADEINVTGVPSMPEELAKAKSQVKKASSSFDTNASKYKVALHEVLEAAERGLVFGHDRKLALNTVVAVAKRALDKE